MSYSLFRFAILIIAFFGHFSPLLAQTPVASSLTGETLISFLQANYYPTSVFSYNAARDTMYLRIDNPDDSVRCVYTGFTIPLKATDGDPSTIADTRNVNAEHTWPQSMYNSASPMVSDLHHLFPAWAVANSTRNNHPFAEIADNLTSTWLFNGTTTTSIPAVSVRNNYAEYYNSTFEPREIQKGNTARAMFYFWAVYQAQSAITEDETDNATFFNGMKSTLLSWHYADPVDAAENTRNEAIFNRQGNRNPFILDSTLARRAFFSDSSPANASADTVTTKQLIISQYYEGASNDKFVEVTNVGRHGINFTSTTVYLCLFSNPTGSIDGIAPSSNVKLSGYLAPGASLIFKNSQAVTPATAVTAGISSGVTGFSGNDPIILSSTNTSTAWANRIDVFGLTDGTNFGVNTSLYRKSRVLLGAKSYDPAQWSTVAYTSVDAAASNTTEYLGYHAVNASFLIGGTQGWRLISNSSTPATTLQYIWAQTSTPNVYSFNSVSQAYTAVANLSDPSLTGKPLAVFVFSDDNYDGSADSFPKVFTQENPVSTGTVNFTIPEQSEKWTLVGNPFNATLNWDSMSKSNVSGSIIIWNNSTLQYMYWNGLVGTGGLTNGHIPVGSAFWVRTTGPNATLSADETDFASTRIALYKSFSAVRYVRFSVGNSEAILMQNGENATWMPSLNTEQPQIYLTKSVATGAFAILSTPDFSDGLDFQIVVRSTSESLTPVISENKTDVSVGLEKVLTKSNSLELLHPVSAKQNSVTETIWRIRFGTQTQTEREIPIVDFGLKNYPNPFNPTTTITFSLPKARSVKLSVYNAVGQEVRALVNTSLSAGKHQVTFDATQLSNGVYFYRLEFGNQVLTKKMLLMK